METTTKDFTNDIENKYHNSGQISLRNFVDYKIEFGKKYLIQFLLGVTKQDPISVSFENYKMNMEEQLKKTSGTPEFIGHVFRGDDMTNLRAVLGELAVYLNIEVDSDKMIGRLNRIDQNSWYYIVVTAVKYKIAYVE